MGSIGSWMSPSVRMTAACGIGRQLATWLSCARSPSTSSVTAEQPRSACGRVASRPPGMMNTCCLYWPDEFMRRPWVVGAARAGGLHHHHGDELLLGIDPEVGAGVPRPGEVAGRARDAGDPLLLSDRDAETERVALDAREQFARLHGLPDGGRQMVGGHPGDRCAAQ